jgi:hypothetical protein
METSQVKTIHPSKQRGYRFWIGRLALLLGLPLLLYYGYCWGLWGRGSLLLQYLFQCGCPVSSEELRYPARVDVVVPACRHMSSRLSPSGRLLYVREEKFGVTTAYLLDLQTMERIKVADQPFSSFLTDDLWFVESGLEDYIMDRGTGVQYPIQKFVHSRPDAEINADANLTLLAESLRRAEEVFLIGASQDTVIALASDFRAYPERNFTVDRFDIPGSETNRMERFLKENNIAYQTIPPDFPDEAVSPDERFVARNDGIYLAETNQKIVEGVSLSVRGWTYDGRGALYSHALGRCLLRIRLPFADDTGCFTRVPQPVLKLKVPD